VTKNQQPAMKSRQ